MSKKDGPFRRFAKAIKEIRKQPLNREAVERFNRIIEKKESPKPARKIARPPETNL